MGGVGLKQNFQQAIVLIIASVWTRLSVDRGIATKTCGNFASNPRQAEKTQFCRDLMGRYFLAVLYVHVHVSVSL